MDTKNTREEVRENRQVINQKAQRLRADGRERRNRSIRNVNSMWLWLGVLILISILLWWLYTIGTFEVLTGITNG